MDDSYKRTADSMNDGSNHDNDAKRARTETSNRVLHVRGLPLDVVEQELITLGPPFGAVTGVLVLSGKGQGFIEMETEAHASALLAFYAAVPAQVRNKTAYLQFSNRGELSKSNLSGGRVLLVSVENVYYPVTIDTIHTVFQAYGHVEKIVLLNKQGFQALVQYPDSNSAMAAKIATDGQNIYQGCCTVKIQFSNLQELTVKQNSEKARDYTSPYSAAGGAGSTLLSGLLGHPQGGMGGGMQSLGGPMSHGGMGMGVQSMGAMGGSLGGGASGSSVILVNNLDVNHVTPDTLCTLFGTCGDVVRVKILFNKRSSALIQFGDASHAQGCVQHFNGCPLFGQQLAVSLSKHSTVSAPSEKDTELGLCKEFSGSPLNRFSGRSTPPVAGPSDVLHLANLSANIDEAQINSVFGQYGSVLNFRYFHNDNKMAVLKMTSQEEAVAALVALHNTQLDGKTLKVSFSKSGFRG